MSTLAQTPPSLPEGDINQIASRLRDILPQVLAIQERLHASIERYNGEYPAPHINLEEDKVDNAPGLKSHLHETVSELEAQVHAINAEIDLLQEIF